MRETASAEVKETVATAENGFRMRQEMAMKARRQCEFFLLRYVRTR